MSASTLAAEAPLARDRSRRPGLARLTGVELRKMVDTRAGFWVQLGVLALTVTFAILSAVIGHTADHTLHGIVTAAVWPAYALLPVVGILLVTSEWSQRTTLITFSLVPQRSRVLAAKLGAGVLLASAAVVVALGIAALVTAVAAPGIAGTWSLSGRRSSRLLRRSCSPSPCRSPGGRSATSPRSREPRAGSIRPGRSRRSSIT
jgi:ABC-2 type transport system permease protein